MSKIIEEEEIEFIPINEDIIIEILSLKYGKNQNIFIKALYNDIVFDFSVFWRNNYCSADNKFSFKILNKDKQLEAPDYKIVAKFDVTKNDYLKCLSARKV